MRAPTAALPPLLRACHPGPTVAVTVVAAALSWGAGSPSRDIALLALAVLSGQLVIGWANDARDADLDVHAGRTDKPVATGELTTGQVRRAAWAAAAVCVPLSAALGVAAGTVHLLGVVGSGLAYDLALKPTRWSWLPFAVAFGLLPAVATLASPAAVWPPAWACLAGACLGVAAHLVNALPDLAQDEAHGVRGLPHRLGPAGTRLATAGALVLATAALVIGPAGGADAVSSTGWLLLAGSLVVSGAALLPRWGRAARTPFVLVAALAVVDVAVMVGRGTSLT